MSHYCNAVSQADNGKRLESQQSVSFKCLNADLSHDLETDAKSSNRENIRPASKPRHNFIQDEFSFQPSLSSIEVDPKVQYRN